MPIVVNRIQPYFFFILCQILLAKAGNVVAQSDVRLIPVDSGWANNSVNATVFRKNSIVSLGKNQFTAFYNASKHVVLASRITGESSWRINETPYTGNADDAHNVISIMIDGAGYLHVAWDHHNTILRYCRSREPFSTELTAEMPMTGFLEGRVSYPEFYKLKSGNLLFMYRNGESGEGNLVINEYDLQTKKWIMLQNNLISGEGQRNAYWQSCVDGLGTIHISWVWREAPDVASNHDLCYARSTDGGKTWEKSTGEKYTIPITAANAEYIARIPQNSELINQTSMTTDGDGVPYIATYWRAAQQEVPQYHLLYKTGGRWQDLSLIFRKTPFTLSGAGTKRIPIARPQILVSSKRSKTRAVLLFRDAERGNKVSAAILNNVRAGRWTIRDLTTSTVGMWEPSFDTELWRTKEILNLFVEDVEQVDGEGRARIPAKMISILEWKPFE